jgi:hypothetical protein
MAGTTAGADIRNRISVIKEGLNKNHWYGDFCFGVLALSVEIRPSTAGGTSPNALLETGLRVRPPEKSPDSDAFHTEYSVLSLKPEFIAIVGAL